MPARTVLMRKTAINNLDFALLAFVAPLRQRLLPEYHQGMFEVLGAVNADPECWVPHQD
jgi:hypothetical protein